MPVQQEFDLGRESSVDKGNNAKVKVTVRNIPQ
jgi:hypothetical protein